MRWSTLTLLIVIATAASIGLVAGRKLVKAKPLSTLNSTRTATAHSGESVNNTAHNDPETSSAPWQDRWQNALGRTSTPARTRELAALIEDLARTDPQRALDLAKAESNWRLRDLLRNAALKGWASVEPLAAANFALTIRPEERRSAVEALMQGAAANPAEAVKTALHLCQSDPEPAGDYGHYTIAALVDAGAFDQAVKFGNQIGTDKFPFLLKSAFFQWARNQPTDAVAATENISDPVLRAQAYGEAISGWAWSDAKAVAEYALKLPNGSARTDALAEALPRWVEKDPNAATEWINRLDTGTEFDAGIEAVANLQSLIQGQPTTAMTLASNITDPARRNHALRAIFRQWAANDPASAQRFVDSNPSHADRTLLLDELKDMSPN